MQSGYTKSWRKKYSGKTASRGLLYVGAMDWLVGNANFYDGWADGQKCGRGQLYIGRAALARVWKVSEQTVRTILKNLEKDGFITSISTNKGTILTILNYNTYQSEAERNQPANQPAINQRELENREKSTSKSTSSDSVINPLLSTTNESDKNAYQPANQPATNQRPPANQPLNKNNKYINDGAQQRQMGFVPNAMPPPRSSEEVKAEAERIGYAMTSERAYEFIAHYEALGWRLNGGYIMDWRRLLPRWRSNESQHRNGAFNYVKTNENNFGGRKRIANADEFSGFQPPQII